VKLERIVDGSLTRLTIERTRFRYEPEGAPPIEREFSLEPAEPGAYSVLIEGRSYEVVVGGGDAAASEIRVNGRALNVEVFDPRGMRGLKSAAAGEGPYRVAALMPGKVVRVLVEPGELVEAGHGLVVVEAMKMQNEMKSPKAGRVAEVRTSANATVAAGEILVVIE
jgi:biotin carboxyl carrier protein